MNRNSPPCHNCLRREVGCHSWCEEYADYKAQRQAALEKKYSHNKAFGDLIAIWRENIRKKRGHL